MFSIQNFPSELIPLHTTVKIIFGNVKLQNNHNYKAAMTSQSLKFKSSSYLSPNSIGF